MILFSVNSPLATSEAVALPRTAANVINSSKVLVIKEGQTYYAWGETPPLEVLNHSSGVQIIPKEQEEEVTIILPFQVLFIPDIQLGGDRNQLAFVRRGLPLDR